MISRPLNFLFSHFSWVNFWINPECTPERAGLTITLALAQIVLLVGTAQRFPSTSDFKMVDLYLLVCFLFQIACLIETVLAAVLFRNGEKKEQKQKLVAKSDKGLTSTGLEDDTDELKYLPAPENNPLDNRVGNIFIVAFLKLMHTKNTR